MWGRMAVNVQRAVPVQSLIKEAYYLCPKENVVEILDNGILTNSQFKARGLQSNLPLDLVNEEISKLKERKLGECVSLFLRPLNCAAFKRIEASKALGIDLVVLVISKQVFGQGNALFCPTNGARRSAEYRPFDEATLTLQEVLYLKDPRSIRPDLSADGQKRKSTQMAEGAVPKKVAPEFITKIAVPNVLVKERVLQVFRKEGKECPIPVVINPSMFFGKDRFIPNMDVEATIQAKRAKALELRAAKALEREEMALDGLIATMDLDQIVKRAFAELQGRPLSPPVSDGSVSDNEGDGSISDQENITPYGKRPYTPPKSPEGSDGLPQPKRSRLESTNAETTTPLVKRRLGMHRIR